MIIGMIWHVQSGEAREPSLAEVKTGAFSHKIQEDSILWGFCCGNQPSQYNTLVGLGTTQPDMVVPITGFIIWRSERKRLTLKTFSSEFFFVIQNQPRRAWTAMNEIVMTKNINLGSYKVKPLATKSYGEEEYLP